MVFTLIHSASWFIKYMMHSILCFDKVSGNGDYKATYILCLLRVIE
jgi:hypothetical protein